uniref:solute carrier family 13 member 2-like isoform X2 n=1 Tax=Ciona intestinalis TaxID=7719 RepID=UPI00089DBF24|nr:solute carrier family 13 member 2-like isoform X2 [Ciona intestinalis]|eukprot:XP_018671214.1 solute carrier family 13 member 2-like isoform X2 [Ciona intestinalis]
MNFRKILSIAWIYRNSLIIVITPLLLLPLVGKSEVASCAFSLCIMAVYWTTEACPLAVTSLLPIILFPMLGIISADNISMMYTRQINFLFVGGLIMAVAIQEWNLHRRIALKVLMLIGSRPCWILLGLMVVTAMLSMWISNTATTAMMVPIASAVYDQMSDLKQAEKSTSDEEASLKDDRDRNSGEALPSNRTNEEILSDGVTVNVTNIPSTVRTLNDDKRKKSGDKNLRKAMLLCIAYSANIGGFATLIGTPANLLLPGALISVFGEGAAEQVDFVSWMGFSLPISVTCLFFTWIWLQFRFIGIRQLWQKGDKQKDNRVKAYIFNSYRQLGPISFGEMAVFAHFVILAILWLTRDPKFISGWKDLFPQGLIKDSTSAMLICFSLFVFPSKNPFRKSEDPSGLPVASPPLLGWKTLEKNFAWDVFFLLGAGFALARACEDSGLSDSVGDAISGLGDISPAGFALIISIILSLLTEFTSNVSTASIFLPILCRLASHSGIHPLYIAIPATISCSFAFSLPVATPPNAIAFSYGGLKVKDLISTGLVLNFICVLILNGFLNTTGVAIFNLNDVSSLSNLTNQL